MLAVRLCVGEKHLTIAERIHIVATVGKEVDCHQLIRLFGFDLLAIEFRAHNFALGIIHHFSLFAHSVATTVSHHTESLNQVFTLDIEHHKAVVEWEGRINQTFRNHTLRHILTNTALVHDSEVNLAGVEGFDNIHNGIRQPVLVCLAVQGHFACALRYWCIHD